MRAAIADARLAPVVNIVLDPLVAADWTGIGTPSGSSLSRTPAPWSPHGEWAYTRTAGSQETAAGVGAATAPLLEPVQAGDHLYWSLLAYHETGERKLLVPYWERRDSTAYTGGSGGPAVEVHSHTPTRVWGERVFLESNAGRTAFAVGFTLSAVTPLRPGEWISATAAQASPDAHHPYIDGSMPGARWLGTPNASPSVGYPRPD